MPTAAELNTAAALAIGRNLRWTSAGSSALEQSMSEGRTAPPSAASDGFDVEGSLVAYVAFDLHAAPGRPGATITYTGTPTAGNVIGIAIDGVDFDFTVSSGVGETALAALTGLRDDINAGALSVTATVEDSVLYVRADDDQQHSYAAHSGADIDPDIAAEASYATPVLWFLMDGSTVWRQRPDLVCGLPGVVSNNTSARLNVAGVDRIAIAALASDAAWTARVALADASST